MSQPQKTTIVFPIDRSGNRVLLGMKKRGFGEGWWNGFGGKLGPEETYKQSAVRETFEESHVTTVSLKLAARLLFYFDEVPTIVSAVYLCDNFTGEPQETEEMRPKWFAIGDLPLEQMWGGDKYWVPHVLTTGSDRVLDVAVFFDGDNNYLSWRSATAEEIDPLFNWAPET